MLPVVVRAARLAVVRGKSQDALLEQVERAEVCGTEPPRGLDDLVEDRLQAGRASNRAQNTADRALLLTEIVKLRCKGPIAGHLAQLRNSTDLSRDREGRAAPRDSQRSSTETPGRPRSTRCVFAKRHTAAKAMQLPRHAGGCRWSRTTPR